MALYKKLIEFHEITKLNYSHDEYSCTKYVIYINVCGITIQNRQYVLILSEIGCKAHMKGFSLQSGCYSETPMHMEFRVFAYAMCMQCLLTSVSDRAGPVIDSCLGGRAVATFGDLGFSWSMSWISLVTNRACELGSSSMGSSNDTSFCRMDSCKNRLNT